MSRRTAAKVVFATQADQHLSRRLLSWSRSRRGVLVARFLCCRSPDQAPFGIVNCISSLMPGGVVVVEDAAGDGVVFCEMRFSLQPAGRIILILRLVAQLAIRAEDLAARVTSRRVEFVENPAMRLAVCAQLGRARFLSCIIRLINRF